VFFGEQLPKRFYECVQKDFKDCDALIVMGTSLSVMPFGDLINQVDERVPRLLINREECGVSGHYRDGFDFTGDKQAYKRDAIFLGDCDEGVKLLAKELGIDLSPDEISLNFRKLSLE
jgi:NAD-dependent deacetylase sirtuin 2